MTCVALVNGLKFLNFQGDVGVTPAPKHPPGGREIGLFLGLRETSSRNHETDPKELETKTGSLETELRVHRIHGSLETGLQMMLRSLVAPYKEAIILIYMAVYYDIIAHTVVFMPNLAKSGRKLSYDGPSPFVSEGSAISEATRGILSRNGVSPKPAGFRKPISDVFYDEATLHFLLLFFFLYFFSMCLHVSVDKWHQSVNEWY